MPAKNKQKTMKKENAPSPKEIGIVITKIKKAVRGFGTPVSTEVSEKTHDPFRVLVSCLLSLRTKDTITGPVSRKLFAVAKTPKEIAEMPLRRLRSIIRPVNFYKTKARRIRDISKELAEKHGSEVPSAFDGLMAFKGVGRKTANIVMVYGHSSKGHIPVDIHVHRIPNRLGWIKTKTPEQTEEELMRLVPKRHWMDINNVFVTFGQNVCLPVSPKCSTCPVRRQCRRAGVTRSR